MGKKKEGIRVVLDTNVPVSILFFGGRSARIVGTPYPQLRINPNELIERPGMAILSHALASGLPRSFISISMSSFSRMISARSSSSVGM